MSPAIFVLWVAIVLWQVLNLLLVLPEHSLMEPAILNYLIVLLASQVFLSRNHILISMFYKYYHFCNQRINNNNNSINLFH